MNALVWLLLALGWAGEARPKTAVLTDFRWHVVVDSVRMDFDFAGVEPGRYRVRELSDSSDNHYIMAEFDGARLDSAVLKRFPPWFKVVRSFDSTLLVLRIDLDKPTPWKMSWEGNWYRLCVLNVVHREPFWKNRWVTGGVGSALLVGGTILWLTSGKPGASPGGSANDTIPPPDMTLP